MQRFGGDTAGKKVISNTEKTFDCNIAPGFTASLVSSQNTIYLLAHAGMDENFIIRIFDAASRQVFTGQAFIKRGFNEITLDGISFSRAVYFVTMQGKLNYFSGKIFFANNQ